MNNNNEWDTDNVSFVGVGAAAGGNGALEAMLNPNGINVTVPWVQDPEKEVWDEFLGAGAPRRQIVLLDQNLEKRFQQHYNGPLSDQEKVELFEAINELISELSELLGDVNGDSNLNIQDVILLVSMALGSLESDLIGDLNQDGGVNILDVVLLVNIILE